MFKLSIPLVFLLFSAACSLYKSESRKNFESTASANLSRSFLYPHFDSLSSNESHQQQMQCDEVSEIQYWYDTRFPAPHTEWVESGSELLEVWQSEDEAGHIHVRSYEQTPPSITRCKISFASKAEWRRFQRFYFKSLEGAQL